MLEWIIFIIPVILLAIYGAAIVYNLIHFALEGDFSKRMANIFTAISVVFFVLAFIAFLRINWSNFSNFTIFLPNNPESTNTFRTLPGY